LSEFGRQMLEHWPLEPGITYLNHGTVGVTPRRVLLAQQAIRDEMERQPSRFVLREMTEIRVGQPRTDRPRLREAAHVVAEFLKADGDDLVFVDNTTTGSNAVMRSFPLMAGDEILVSDFGYGGVTRAAQFAARERGASVRSVMMPYPVRSASEIVDAFTIAIGPNTRVAIVDHVASESAFVMPLAEIAVRCHERNVAVLADGAHAPGAFPVDVPSLGVDWYVGNLHKWCWVPRSSGILWASRARQQGLHPPVISWGLDQGFTAEFDAPGTRDASAHLSAPHAIGFMREFGLDAVQQYNHSLAWNGARLLADRWRTDFITPESLVGTMATVMMPDRFGKTSADAARVRDALLFDHHIEVHTHAFRDRLYARISAQIYNSLEDVERLADAVLRLN
jgi:isopenicillin-N epimerase